MAKELKILMVDDHPSMIEGYKSILSFNEMGYVINVVSAHNAENAYNLMTNAPSIYEYDLLFFDLSIPAYPEKEIYSGKDLAAISRNYFPYAKVLILTSHAEAFLLHQIKNNIKPDGLLLKSDFTAEELLRAFEFIMRGEIYNSKTVLDVTREVSKTKILLDSYNQQIMQLLAQGMKAKNIASKLGLSLSAVDKRKAQIKQYFDVSNGTDEDIIREARKNGFI